MILSKEKIKKLINKIIRYLLFAKDKFKIYIKKFSIIDNKNYRKYYYNQFQKSITLGENFEKHVQYNFQNEEIAKVKNIALYLPQFHSIPENDKWWGKNYTEWNSVVKAVPQYVGQHQPHLPYDVGFYDLNNIEALKLQVQMAKNYGIYGFCYYFYWFNGKQLLEKPLNMLLKSKIDMPFCLFYANDSWTRTWHGFSDFDVNQKKILIEQNHNDLDDKKLMEYLINVFKDNRYIKINNKPLFVIYHTYLFKDFEKTIDTWKKVVKKNGFDDLFLVNVMMPNQQESSSVDIGTEAMMQFSPISCKKESFKVKSLNKNFQGEVFDYRKLVESELTRKFDSPIIRTAFPSWDNEARRPGKGISYFNSSPKLFYEYLKGMNNYSLSHPLEGESIVFINAWNEWAEGAHLEPDREHGYAYLNKIAQIIKENNKK